MRRAQAPRSKSESLRTVDLFCGSGGLSLGFANAGFEILAAFDNWDPAIEVYGANFEHPVIKHDLSDVESTVNRLLEYSPDVIIGGPPCQDFSIAGKRVEAQRADLTVAFGEIVASVEPALVVMENVYNIAKSTQLPRLLRRLRAAGYGITTRIIDASRAGVPQSRNRFFLIARFDGIDDEFGPALDTNLAQSPLTVREYFGASLDVNHYYAHPRSYKRRAVFSVDEPSATIRRVNRPIPPSYVQHPADSVPVSAAVRPLTTSERSRIQTFPESFRWLGSRSHQEQMIGNAVPVKLAEYVARCILETQLLIAQARPVGILQLR